MGYQRTISNVAPGSIGIWLFMLIALAACNENEDAGESSPQYVEMGDDYGLTAEIKGDRSLTRRWVKRPAEKITTLSEGEGYTLFTPGLAATVSNEGHIYVPDRGSYTVKAFTLEGEYVATYGRGRGRGPGEVMIVTDVGTWKDSLIYLVDPRVGRVSLFEKSGEFVRTEPYRARIARIAIANDSTVYGATPPSTPTFLRITVPTNRQLTISRLFSDEVHPIMLDGWLHTIEDRVVYVPSYFPVLLSFSPADTSGIAHPTPDYGQPRPKARTRNSGQVRAPSSGTRFHRQSTLHNGVLAVEVPDSKNDNLRFDLYDAQEMEYTRSVQVSVEGSDAIYVHGEAKDIIATVDEATVNIYHVQNSR